MEVTDMILDADQQIISNDLPDVALRPLTQQTRTMILSFVKTEHVSFLQYYESPKVGTDVYMIMHNGEMVGAVLIEKQPGAAESTSDGAIACLIISKHFRGQRLGSAAIVACCNKLREIGFQRVIAEWVASIELYKRLGFRIWKTREIGSE